MRIARVVSVAVAAHDAGAGKAVADDNVVRIEVGEQFHDGGRCRAADAD